MIKKNPPTRGWQTRPGLSWAYRFIGISWVYQLIIKVLALGADHLLHGIRLKLFGKTRGYVLDVGCGPRLPSPFPRGVVVGVDVNSSYLRAYTGGRVDEDPEEPFRKSPPHRRFGYLADAQSLPFPDHCFDEIRATAFFHHLDNRAIRNSLIEMRRCLKPRGRLLFFDAVWPKHGWARPLAWLTLSFDRGRHMRTEEQLRFLLTDNLRGKWYFHRMTYSYTGLECLWAVFCGDKGKKSNPFR